MNRLTALLIATSVLLLIYAFPPSTATAQDYQQDISVQSNPELQSETKKITPLATPSMVKKTSSDFQIDSIDQGLNPLLLFYLAVFVGFVLAGWIVYWLFSTFKNKSKQK